LPAASLPSAGAAGSLAPPGIAAIKLSIVEIARLARLAARHARLIFPCPARLRATGHHAPMSPGRRPVIPLLRRLFTS